MYESLSIYLRGEEVAGIVVRNVALRIASYVYVYSDGDALRSGR
jgi:hypothetical protein